MLHSCFTNCLESDDESNVTKLSPVRPLLKVDFLYKGDHYVKPCCFIRARWSNGFEIYDVKAHALAVLIPKLYLDSSDTETIIRCATSLWTNPVFFQNIHSVLSLEIPFSQDGQNISFQRFYAIRSGKEKKDFYWKISSNFQRDLQKSLYYNPAPRLSLPNVIENNRPTQQTQMKGGQKQVNFNTHFFINPKNVFPDVLSRKWRLLRSNKIGQLSGYCGWTATGWNRWKAGVCSSWLPDEFFDQPAIVSSRRLQSFLQQNYKSTRRNIWSQSKCYHHCVLCTFLFYIGTRVSPNPYLGTVFTIPGSSTAFVSSTTLPSAKRTILSFILIFSIRLADDDITHSFKLSGVKSWYSTFILSIHTNSCQSPWQRGRIVLTMTSWNYGLAKSESECPQV